MDERLLTERACAAWDIAASDAWVDTAVACRSGVVVGAESGSNSRVAYLSAGSPIEKVLGTGNEVLDRSGAALSITELAHRLTSGEVAALVATGSPSGKRPEALGADALPSSFVSIAKVFAERMCRRGFCCDRLGSKRCRRIAVLPRTSTTRSQACGLRTSRSAPIRRCCWLLVPTDNATWTNCMKRGQVIACLVRWSDFTVLVFAAIRGW